MAPYDFSKEAKETDKELADDLNKLSGLSNNEIAELLPNRADQEQLKALIDAIKRETEVNQKKAVLLDRLADVAPVVREAVKGLVKIAA